MHRTAMWKRYAFRGHRVTIVQQWRDSFGRPMVALATVIAGEERTDGLTEAEFLREAEPLAQTDEQPAEIAFGQDSPGAPN